MVPSIYSEVLVEFLCNGRESNRTHQKRHGVEKVQIVPDKLESSPGLLSRRAMFVISRSSFVRVAHCECQSRPLSEVYVMVKGESD